MKPASLVLVLGALAAAGGGLLSCSAENNPSQQGTVGGDQPPNSITRLNAPSPRSPNLTLKVNQRRAETYGMEIDVQHIGALYTAAYRHSVYLNTVNSGPYQTASSGTISTGIPDTIITPDSLSTDLQDEVTGTATTTSLFPALATNSTLYGRIRAVVGGDDVLGSTTPETINEDYVVDGTVAREDGSWAGQFRGYPLSTGSFDEVDSLWYSRHGRVLLMRPSLRYIGYGAARDGSIVPPWPVLNGQFRGTMIAVGTYPLYAQRGFWPSQNFQDVNPYGTDTDVGGPNQYSGPPIHFTLPVAEPILVYPNSSFYLEFQKMQNTPETPSVVQPPPAASIQRKFKVYSSVSGLSAGGISTGLSPAYQYTGAGDATPVVNAGRVSSVNPNAAQPSATSTYSLTPVPTGYSTVTFDSAVDLTSVAQGDLLTLNITNAGAYPYPGQYNGAYTVIWNSEAPITGQPTLPPNSLAISYINSETSTGAVYVPNNSFYNVFATPAMSRQLPSFVTPGTVSTNTATVTSNSRARFSTVLDIQDNYHLRDGEIFIVPTQPLEPNSWYEVRVYAATVSGPQMFDNSDPVGNPNNLFKWRFKTNNKTVGGP